MRGRERIECGSVLSAGAGAYAGGIGERMECRCRVLRRGGSDMADEGVVAYAGDVGGRVAIEYSALHRLCSYLNRIKT